MKPSERNVIQNKAKEAAQEISKLERALAKFTPGTLPYNKTKERIAQAKAKQDCAKAKLAHTTQPNRKDD